jgi:lysophospholipase L1-like esterase
VNGKKGIVIGINAAITLGILLALEVFSRIMLSHIYNRDFDSKLIVDNKYFDSPGLIENGSGKVWGKTFHTDSCACRRSSKSYVPGKKKWLFIGDSVTEGVGVEDSATFSSLFFEHEDSLNVLNYSLIGYSDADYFNVLKARLATDSTIKRVTIFFCLNDVYGKSGSKNLPVMARQNLVGQINAFLQMHYATYKLLKLFLYQHSNRYFQYDLQFYKPDDLCFNDAMAILQQCDSFCRNNGADLNVIMLPYKSQLHGKDAGNRIPQNLVGKFCKMHEISFADPADYLTKRQDAGALYLFGDEIHFSAAGHRAMADYILSQ